MTSKIPFGDNYFKDNTNYYLIMEKEIEKVKLCKRKPTLLLHSCCAPCSSHVLSVLQKYFEITILFYNPNIYPEDEYLLRKAELIKLINILNEETKEKENNNTFEDSIFHESKIEFMEEKYNAEEFYNVAKNYEKEKEGSPRCFLCYTLRIEETGKLAKENNFDYFCTTLTVSPYKNVFWINEIGKTIAEKFGVKFLFSAFKKNNGYQHSIELSNKYGLYRQHYCGCEYSLKALNNK